VDRTLLTIQYQSSFEVSTILTTMSVNRGSETRSVPRRGVTDEGSPLRRKDPNTPKGSAMSRKRTTPSTPHTRNERNPRTLIDESPVRTPFMTEKYDDDEKRRMLCELLVQTFNKDCETIESIQNTIADIVRDLEEDAPSAPDLEIFVHDLARGRDRKVSRRRSWSDGILL
jgi:hypothetical protein